MQRTLITSIALFALAAGQATATGPSNQRVPWQAGGGTLNSVVQVNAGGFFGTGSVVHKTVGTDGNLWLGVLTADHVARPGGRSGWGAQGGQTITFGDNAAQGSFGGARRSFYSQLPAVDLAFVGINLGPNNAMTNAAGVNRYNNTTLINFTSFPATSGGAPAVNNQNFTHLGYGGTGVIGPAAAPTGIVNTGADGNKRFQDNRLAGTRAVAPNWTTGADNYNYTAINWIFDNPAGMNAVLYEGTSFGGDSGGPYMSSGSTTITVGTTNFTLRSNTIFGVHTYGTPAAPIGTNAAFGRESGGVPLLPAYVNWINQRMSVLPAPGSLGLLGVAGLVAARRRRA